VGQDLSRTHLHLLDLKTRKVRGLTRGPLHLTGLAWSPNGRAIAFSHQPTPRADEMFRASLSVVPVGGGRPRVLVSGQGGVAAPTWSPDGGQIAFLSTSGWLGSTHVHLVSPEGGPVRDLTPRLENLARLTEAAWAPDGKALYYFLGQGTAVHLCRVRLNGRTQQLTQGRAVHGIGLSLSRTGGRLALIRQDGSSPPEVFVSSTARIEPRQVTSTNPQLSRFRLGRKEVIRWQSQDGTEVEGLLVKPVGYEPGRRYPLLVCVHGGPAGVFSNTCDVLAQGAYPIQVFAGRGYALLLPNPRGSCHYGERFRQANLRDWGKGDFEDILAGVDHLVGRGIADPGRLGIMGWSYGGYMTGWAITQTHRFRAASFGAGVANLISMYGQCDIPGFVEGYFQALPWEEGETYLKHSAIAQAGHIRTPTLLQHGEQDLRVPLPQSWELYQALLRRRVPAQFVIYPRQPHSLLEPRLVRDAMERNLEWFERWVRGRKGGTRG